MMTTPVSMRVMMLEEVRQPLRLKIVPVPEPNELQVLVKIIACGVCRTDLHIVDGELTHPKLPLIPGHEIVGMVAKKGSQVKTLQIRDFVGIP